MTHPIVWASIVPVRVATYYYCIDKFGRSYPLTEFCHVQNSLCVHLRTIAQVCRAMSVFAIKACMDNRKKLLNSNTSSTCPDNMMNFGLLTAEIGWRVWEISASLATWLREVPFTRYNLLSNRLSNRFDNRLCRVYKHSAGCQPVLSCKRGLTITNRA